MALKGLHPQRGRAGHRVGAALDQASAYRSWVGWWWGASLLCHKNERAGGQGRGKRDASHKAPADVATLESWLLFRCPGQLWVPGVVGCGAMGCGRARFQLGSLQTQLTFRPKLAARAKGLRPSLSLQLPCSLSVYQGG